MRKRIAVKAVIVSAALATCLACVGVSADHGESVRQKTVPIDEQKPKDEKVADAIVVEEPEASIHITEARQIVTVTPIATKAKGKVIADGSEYTGADDDITVSKKDTTTVDSSDAEDAEPEEDRFENDGNGAETDGSIGSDSGSAEATEPEPEPAEAGSPEQQAVEPISLSEESTEVEEPVLVEELPVEETEAPQMEYLGHWTVSFYCNCEICCGSYSGGPTASGVMPTPWYTAATDGLEFGTVVYVEGLGNFVIEDRGTDYGWLDIHVSDHNEALANGLQYRDVYIIR